MWNLVMSGVDILRNAMSGMIPAEGADICQRRYSIISFFSIDYAFSPFFKSQPRAFPIRAGALWSYSSAWNNERHTLVAGKDELQKIMNIQFYTLAMLFSFFSFGRFCKILHRRKLKQLQCHLWTWWCLLKSFSYSYEILIKWIPDLILIILRGKSISSAWLHFAGEENRQNYVRGPY